MCNLVNYVLTLNLDNIFPILRKFGFSIFVGRRRNETTEYRMTDLFKKKIRKYDFESQTLSTLKKLFKINDS